MHLIVQDRFPKEVKSLTEGGIPIGYSERTALNGDRIFYELRCDSERPDRIFLKDIFICDYRIVGDESEEAKEHPRKTDKKGFLV
jgi:hypothetical protein